MSTGSAVQTKLQFEKQGPHDIANGKAKIGMAAKRNEDNTDFENLEAHLVTELHLRFVNVTSNWAEVRWPHWSLPHVTLPLQVDQFVSQDSALLL